MLLLKFILKLEASVLSETFGVSMKLKLNWTAWEMDGFGCADLNVSYNLLRVDVILHGSGSNGVAVWYTPHTLPPNHLYFKI